MWGNDRHNVAEDLHLTDTNATGKALVGGISRVQPNPKQTIWDVEVLKLTSIPSLPRPFMTRISCSGPIKDYLVKSKKTTWSNPERLTWSKSERLTWSYPKRLPAKIQKDLPSSPKRLPGQIQKDLPGQIQKDYLVKPKTTISSNPQRLTWSNPKRLTWSSRSLVVWWKRAVSRLPWACSGRKGSSSRRGLPAFASTYLFTPAKAWTPLQTPLLNPSSCLVTLRDAESCGSFSMMAGDAEF